MYISEPTFDNERKGCFAERTAWSTYQGLGGLHGTHSANKSFPDPEGCYSPGSKGKPNWRKTILKVEAALEIPNTCTGSIIARTTLRDVVPGGASSWAEVIRFGVSDGTHLGGLEKATKVVESDGKTLGVVEFAKTIPWDGKSCTARNDLFVYVRFPPSGKVFTFIEIGFYPRVESNNGVPVDKSPNPAIRLNPCNHLMPIRSPYIGGVLSDRYWKLNESERKLISEEVSRMFKQETGIARRLDWDNPNDRPLARQWLRIRDEVMMRR